MATPVPLAPIPIVDLRDGGPVRHALEGRARARALREEALAWFPRGMLALTPALDRAARRWLTRSHGPYVSEIAAVATALGFPGIWFLNNSYQWCCTARACEQDAAPWLVRTLDWPCDGLGRHVEVARMAGPAGEFFNVTWPGFVGVLTAMAPGRFAAAINQAPLFRRTRHRWLRPVDLAANAVATFVRVRHMPPDHLLRLAFETCPSYAEARRLLERVPVARPVIFTLAGGASGERCLIERSEEGYATHDEAGAARRLGGLARPVSHRRLRLGGAAGAQPLHPRRGRNVPARGHPARRGLRTRRGRRAADAGHARVRD